ncbi:DUF5643 domain-containing protein [Nitrosopumilus sp.]|uniref:DUF5643 domain-containing protein n=1 Tax=Nitrosopumilus sp. TaxID=2024843 RepID=UPI00247E6794|nr:DUF5643 domain-containing protein [Nitrosopumilus sp.]MCV0409612.1 DUF5643 domain-containing protein [Nitrosopumilus sp.]
MNRFRLLPPTVDDFDTTIVRIGKSQMEKMGLHDGDTVKVTGMKSSGALCYSIDDDFKLPNDSDITYLSENPTILPSLRAGNFVGYNINRHGSGLIPVSVEKVYEGTRPASKVCLMSLNSGSDDESFARSKLDALIVCENDRLNFRDAVPQNNFGYHITCVEPSDYAQITKDTVIEFVKIKPDKISSFFSGPKLERLQDVIPIVYQETLNDVNVTIPSLEIFDTGIRFALYIKSDFEPSQTIQNGATSVVVTLEDDLGNLHELTNHGGGGSSSQNGFEYKHEFLGKPLHHDAKQITITLHEILIQERFPRESPGSVSRKPMRGTKEEYAKIDKFPAFVVISGPWTSTVQLN